MSVWRPFLVWHWVDDAPEIYRSFAPPDWKVDFIAFVPEDSGDFAFLLLSRMAHDTQQHPVDGGTVVIGGNA